MFFTEMPDNLNCILLNMALGPPFSQRKIFGLVSKAQNTEAWAGVAS
jgi:hypothetical protein